MSERENLLKSIAATTTDYRKGDIKAPTPEHVGNWVDQFPADVRLTILREMDHVLKKTYFSRFKAERFLKEVFGTKKLVGDDPCAFWKNVNFLNIQDRGSSQKEMLDLFDGILNKNCDFNTTDCGGNSRVFVYLDDAAFTGNRAKQDLENWIKKPSTPAETEVHVIVVALHRGGQFYAHKSIRKATENANKNMNLTWWRVVEFEERKRYTNESDVLRPVAIPDDEAVKAYVDSMNYPPNLRQAGHVGKNSIFSSDGNRQCLEQEFLKAGVKIRNMCKHLHEYQRPLGNMVLETLGFGSLIVTFRNCPNNAPLVLWAGDPWYPLFPRKTNKRAP